MHDNDHEVHLEHLPWLGMRGKKNIRLDNQTLYDLHSRNYHSLTACWQERTRSTLATKEGAPMCNMSGITTEGRTLLKVTNVLVQC